MARAKDGMTEHMKEGTQRLSERRRLSIPSISYKICRSSNESEMVEMGFQGKKMQNRNSLRPDQLIFHKAGVQIDMNRTKQTEKLYRISFQGLIRFCI